MMRNWADIKQRIDRNARAKQITITNPSYAEWRQGWTPNRAQIEILKGELEKNNSLFDSDKFRGSNREINRWLTAFDRDSNPVNPNEVKS